MKGNIAPDRIQIKRVKQRSKPTSVSKKLCNLKHKIEFFKFITSFSPKLLKRWNTQQFVYKPSRWRGAKKPNAKSIGGRKSAEGGGKVKEGGEEGFP